MKFPCKDYEFQNTYHFFRAGESLLEEEGIWSTNPLFLTNREAALSPKGIEQVENMCKELRADGVAPTIVRYSLAASATDSSNIIGRELKVGRDRLVPEFNFMDPRAVGSWDMSRLNETLEAVWALDVDEAGNDGIGGRPPSNDDGTPHETLSDQVVRLQNLISVLETQYSGDTILLVFPDGTGPALLTCLIGGIPLSRVHEFEYRNGEVRLNINYESAHSLLNTQPSDEYIEAINRGRQKLKTLLDHPDDVLNVRDQQYAEELRKEAEIKAKLAEAEKEKEMSQSFEMQEVTAKDSVVINSELDGSLGVVAGFTAVGVIGAVSLFASNNVTTESDDLSNKESETNVGENMQIVSMENGSESRVSMSFGDADSRREVRPEESFLLDNNEMSGSLEKPLQAWNPDEDDGGDAWLGTLSEIIKEESDEEADESNSRIINGGGSGFFE